MRRTHATCRLVMFASLKTYNFVRIIVTAQVACVGSAYAQFRDQAIWVCDECSQDIPALLSRGREGVVHIRVTPKTRNPLTIRALSISGVTWKWHFLNHAAPCPGCRGHPVRDGPASSHADNSSDVPGRARRCGPFPFGIALTSPSMPCSWTGGLCSGKNIPRLSKVGLTNSAKIYKLS